MGAPGIPVSPPELLNKQVELVLDKHNKPHMDIQMLKLAYTGHSSSDCFTISSCKGNSRFSSFESDLSAQCQLIYFQVLSQDVEICLTCSLTCVRCLIVLVHKLSNSWEEAVDLGTARYVLITG